jgi:hypothetical protein
MKNFRNIKMMAVTLACLVAAIQIPAPTMAGYVITTDYSIFGSIRNFQDATPFTMSDDLDSIPGDAMGRIFEDLVYVVGRGGSNIIQIFDPSQDFALVREFSLGTGLNLQDIAFIDDGTAYVSCYDDAVLLKVDLDSGTVTNSFSTASFADADGLPETAMMCFYEEKLYIASQLLDRGAWYAPTGPSSILVFDTTIDQWVDMDPGNAGVQPITLQGSNPYTDLVLVQEAGADTKLLVGNVGYYGMTDGGVERVNLTTGLSEGYLVTEADLGGDLTRISRGETGLYAIVADAGFNTGVKFVSNDGATIVSIDQGEGFIYSDLMAGPENLLFLADRTVNNSGVRVFDALTFTELTTDPISTGLPPSLFLLDLTREDEASPVIPDLAGSLLVGHPFPNPCNPTAVLPVTGKAGTTVTVKVVDMRGRNLRDGQLIIDGSGAAEFRFTGMDRHGHTLATGQYRVIFEGEQSWVMRSITLIK